MTTLRPGQRCLVDVVSMDLDLQRDWQHEKGCQGRDYERRVLRWLSEAEVKVVRYGEQTVSLCAWCYKGPDRRVWQVVATTISEGHSITFAFPLKYLIPLPEETP